MALGKRKGNDFLPLAKFDARHGSLFLEDRVYRDGSWQTEQRDVTDNFRAIFDLAGLERGWIAFTKGGAPDMRMVPAGEDPGDAPSRDHKEGIRVLVKVSTDLGGAVREFTSTAAAVWDATDVLHNDYLAEVADHPEQLPIVGLADVIKQPPGKGGPVFAPVWQIERWVPRPTDLPKGGHAANGSRRTTPAARSGDLDAPTEL